MFSKYGSNVNKKKKQLQSWSKIREEKISTIKQIKHVFFSLKDSFAKDDIALLRLRDPVSFGPYVNNIELNTDANFPPDGEDCFAQGWGCTSNNGN